MRWLERLVNSMDMNLSQHQETVKDREVCPGMLQSMGSQSQTQLSESLSRVRLFATP